MADPKKSKKPVAKAAKTTTRKPARAKATPTVSAPTVLLLRTCGPNGEAYGDFCWPLEVGAEVVAPDWSPEPTCGRGLHGLLWGQGDPTSAWRWESVAKWLVIEAAAEDVVDIGGKCKVPRCRIVHVGDQRTATEYLAARAPAGVAIVGGTATAGDHGTATAGYRGTATAGEGGTFCILYWDYARQKWRLAIGEVGEDGIEPNVAYVVHNGKLIRKEVRS